MDEFYDGNGERLADTFGMAHVEDIKDEVDKVTDGESEIEDKTISYQVLSDRDVGTELPIEIDREMHVIQENTRKSLASLNLDQAMFTKDKDDDGVEDRDKDDVTHTTEMQTENQNLFIKLNYKCYPLNSCSTACSRRAFIGGIP